MRYYTSSHFSSFTLVVNPFPQTSHLKGRSFVWLLMWISRAELHANTLKHSWQVVFPRAANISSMSGSNAGGKIKLKSTRQPPVATVSEWYHIISTYVSSHQREESQTVGGWEAEELQSPGRQGWVEGRADPGEDCRGRGGRRSSGCGWGQHRRRAGWEIFELLI